MATHNRPSHLWLSRSFASYNHSASLSSAADLDIAVWRYICRATEPTSLKRLLPVQPHATY